MGISATIIPGYLNSIAPKEITGKLGAFNQVFQTLGVLAAYSLGFMVSEDAAD